MLYENSDSQEGMDLKSSTQRCVPDYEAIIKRTNDKLDKVVELKTALFDYLGKRRVKKELAEMIGELVMEERELADIIKRTISEQEASS